LKKEKRGRGTQTIAKRIGNLGGTLHSDNADNKYFLVASALLPGAISKAYHESQNLDNNSEQQVGSQRIGIVENDEKYLSLIKGYLQDEN